MNVKIRLIITSLISLIGFGMIAILVNGNKIVRFDNAIISFVQGYESGSVTRLMKIFTFFGSINVLFVLTILAMIFFYIILKHRLELILLNTTILGSVVLNHILKYYFHRVRPEINKLIEASGYSFPSGHSMNTLAFYGVITLLVWRHIPTRLGRISILIFSGLMVITVGISRIYLGAHYPSDVIGAYFAAGFWLSIATCLYLQFKERRL